MPHARHEAVCAAPVLLGWLRRMLSALCGLMGAAWAVQRLEWADLGQFDWLGDGGMLPLCVVGGLWSLTAGVGVRAAFSGTRQSIGKPG